jgi:hypothetical protein
MDIYCRQKLNNNILYDPLHDTINGIHFSLQQISLQVHIMISYI